MTWFKVDDKLHDHRKARRAGNRAMGVWVLSGSWSMDNLTDGFIPDDVLLRWGNRTDAGRLVSAGLWFVDEHRGERGWRFHDWDRFQPSAAVTAAVKAKEADAGVRGNHKRWHADRGINDPDCEYCYRVPDQEPDGVTRDEPESGGESGAIRPVPEPDPVPQVSPDGETSRRRNLEIAEPPRADVDRICEHLADSIETNGSKRPEIGKRWRDAARLMLDRDGRTEQEIHGAIDWSQRDEFWRANILSLPSLREKYDTLRLQAQRTNGTAKQQAEEQMWERAYARADAREGGQR